MKSNQKRKLVKSGEVIILVLILCICFIAIYFMNSNKSEGITAQISYKGEIVKVIELNISKDMIFKLEENQNVSFEISSGKIRFVDTVCPDKLCENFGYLNKSNQTSICLPNMVSLKILGKNEGGDDVDIIAN